mmetsp:Transcript_28524/g.68601  ORF Transcript_28524/g.68601 Transcript_28524/m.68601 type:complete len:600 (-) Transcript_28524:287-2086(-)
MSHGYSEEYYGEQQGYGYNSWYPEDPMMAMHYMMNDMHAAMAYQDEYMWMQGDFSGFGPAGNVCPSGSVANDVVQHDTARTISISNQASSLITGQSEEKAQPQLDVKPALSRLPMPCTPLRKLSQRYQDSELVQSLDLEATRSTASPALAGLQRARAVAWMLQVMENPGVLKQEAVAQEVDVTCDGASMLSTLASILTSEDATSDKDKSDAESEVTTMVATGPEGSICHSESSWSTADDIMEGQVWSVHALLQCKPLVTSVHPAVKTLRVSGHQSNRDSTDSREPWKSSRGVSTSGLRAQSAARPRVEVPCSPAARPWARMPDSAPSAVRPQRVQSREQQLAREIRSLLNKIAPENLRTITEKMGNIQLDGPEQMTSAIQIIVTKALADPHYCSTYADMIGVLSRKFRDQEPGVAGRGSFTRMVLNTVQGEYERMPKSLEPTPEQRQQYANDPEGLDYELMKTKRSVLANMKLIGNLYLRNLLVTKVVASVLQTLLHPQGRLPDALELECAVELLKTVGFTLEQAAPEVVEKCVTRMEHLRAGKTFDFRCRCMLQEVVEMRSAGWVMKVKRELAKTLAEAHHSEALFDVVVAGKRPSSP